MPPRYSVPSPGSAPRSSTRWRTTKITTTGIDMSSACAAVPLQFDVKKPVVAIARTIASVTFCSESMNSQASANSV